MITGQIIQRIQSLYSKGVQSDDSRLTTRHIYNKMLTLRSKLITQKVKKKQLISDWSYVLLKCVEIIKVDAHECPCLPQIGCQVYRTKEKIPKPLIDMNNHLIKWVMSIEHSNLFDETTREKELYIKGQRYTNKKKRYLLEDGYIFFYGGNPGKAVAVKILIHDPIEAMNFPSICGEEEICFSPLDMEFAIDEDLIDDLVTMAIPELIGVFNQNPEDLTNNSKDNPTEQSK
jgi:hypothetical protein